ENFPLPVVRKLREFGHDVLTSLEAGNANLSIEDDQVLSFASSQERAVLTLNRKHFVRLHQSGQQHFGIVACSYDPDFLEQACRIHGELQNVSDFNQSLIRINRPSSSDEGSKQ